MPSSFCSDSRRSRICAWIVTSSAVVGSSAISRSGLHASAIAIITRCRMPPESWCGYASTRSSGDGMPTSLNIAIAISRASARDLVLVQAHGFADLIADGEHRVERRHRLLKDHRDPVAADLAHLVERQLQQVFAGVRDRPRRDPSWRIRDQAA